MTHRPFAWEKSYPPALDLGAPIATTTLPAMFDAAVARFGGNVALEFNGRRIAYR